MKRTILLALCILLLLLTGCGSNPPQPADGWRAQAQALGITPVSNSVDALDDVSADYDSGAATTITLGQDIAISGDGAAVTDRGVVIARPGVYVLRGTMEDRQILVDAGKEDVVQLVLDGVSVTHATRAPLLIQDGAQVILTLAVGSVNVLCDGANNTDEAAVVSRTALTVNGTGTLQITGSKRHGLAARDGLTVLAGTLAVIARQNGLHTEKRLRIAGGDLCIQAGNDGLKVTADEKSNDSLLTLEGGTLTVTASKDGIQAGNLYAAGGTVSIAANKGVRSDGDMEIAGGVFALTCADDGLRSDGQLLIRGGDCTVDAGGKGVCAAQNLLFCNGTLDVTRSQEGMEGAWVTVSGGNIRLHAADDGINASGSAESAQQSAKGKGTDGSFTLSGGNVLVNAAGDGVDANGSLSVSGGVLLINGPTDGENGPLDYDTKAAITGGVVVAAGSPQKAMGFCEGSTQGSLLYIFDATQSAGTRVTLTDEDGKVLVSYPPQKEFGAVTISAPGMTRDGTYQLLLGGTAPNADDTGLACTGSLTGGETVKQITLQNFRYPA